MARSLRLRLDMAEKSLEIALRDIRRQTILLSMHHQILQIVTAYDNSNFPEVTVTPNHYAYFQNGDNDKVAKIRPSENRFPSLELLMANQMATEQWNGATGA